MESYGNLADASVGVYGSLHNAKTWELERGVPVYFGAGGYGDGFEDGRVFDLNQGTPQVYYNLLWATREHSFDVSFRYLHGVLHGGILGLIFCVLMLISVVWLIASLCGLEGVRLGLPTGCRKEQLVRLAPIL